MQILKLKKGDHLARRGEKVGAWYIIQSGQIVQCCRVEELSLKENFIIGMLEEDYFWCDYIAKSAASVIVLPKQDYKGLKKLFSEQPQFRGLFLNATMMHKHRELVLYTSLFKNTRSYYDKLQNLYETYKKLCDDFSQEELKFPEFSNLTPIQINHRAETWEFNQSNSLMRGLLSDYLRVVEKDEDLTIGCIMETGRSLKRICQGIDEMDAYLFEQKDILLSESGMDMLRLYFELSVQVAKAGGDVSAVKRYIDEITAMIRSLNIYDEALVSTRVSEYETFDYAHPSLDSELDVLPPDLFGYILSFAGLEKKETEEYRAVFAEYRKLPENTQLDAKVLKLRKTISAVFYDVYEKCFFRAVETGTMPSAVSMFLNFGVLDQDQLSTELLEELFAATRRLSKFNTDHVFTMQEWLMKIYFGEREPSKNEFDLDYDGYLKDEKKNGNIDDAKMKALAKNRSAKVSFEIHNMFETGHKITYGKVSTFVPMLQGADFINTYAKMALTAEKLDAAINAIRAVDFSLLYRPVMYANEACGIKAETLQKEVMPDIILMPICGTKATMWQETAGVKRDTPARLMFPIFTIADVSEMMLENMGRYRWEICRKIQGVHWNDIREKSLTSEYCDYIQFYKKNRDLSQEAKDKMKLTLQRVKNSYREVFVMDYINWIKYEAAGGFRLNRFAREILIRYCPFAKEIRHDLKSNPMFGNAFGKFEADQTKGYTHFKAVNERIEKAGGEITPELRENLLFYEQ